MKPQLEKYAIQNRKKPTPAEQEMFTQLAMTKINFVFQHPITVSNTNAILNFYIPSKHIAIEVDGGYHTTKAQYKKDMERDKILKTAGITTLRISNYDVLNNTKVLKKILKKL